MNKASKSALVALFGLSTLALTATAASAAVVCNAEGVCWHTAETYTYLPEYGVVVHPDNWQWAANEHYAWREHAGRGYWRGGAWVAF
jgi:hypothetical protein